VLNILTIDLEDYFMVSAFEDVVKREDWGNYESRIESNTYRLLDMLNNQSSNPIRVTFFCIGWVAERYPKLIREIQGLGHEIACHSYDHRIVYSMTPGEFREDVRKSRKILEDIIGEEVIGYRAPSYSITNKSQWAFEVLAEEGFKYDSSIFPIHHDFYGFPNAPRFPFAISLNGNNEFEFSVLNVELNPTQNSTLITQNSNFIIEYPISTVKLLGQNVPLSGGGYFRLFPYPMVKRGLNRINKKEGQPFIFYLHPWEIDLEQPRINGLSSRSSFRHYVNLKKTEFKFKKLLSDFEFSSIKESLGSTAASPQHSLTLASQRTAAPQHLWTE